MVLFIGRNFCFVLHLLNELLSLDVPVEVKVSGALLLKVIYEEQLQSLVRRLLGEWGQPTLSKEVHKLLRESGKKVFCPKSLLELLNASMFTSC